MVVSISSLHIVKVEACCILLMAAIVFISLYVDEVLYCLTTGHTSTWSLCLYRERYVL